MTHNRREGWETEDGVEREGSRQGGGKISQGEIGEISVEGNECGSGKVGDLPVQKLAQVCIKHVLWVFVA